MSQLVFNEQAVPSTPAATKVSVWASNDASPILMIKDDGGLIAQVGLTQVDPTDTTKKLTISLSGMTTAKTLTLTITQDTTQTLSVPVIRQAETLAIKPQVLQSTPADPTGTASTTGVMMGLAGAITPQVTGRVAIFVSGNLTNSTAAAGDGAKVQIRHGTGGAPANAAALTGTADGNIVTSVLERATASDLQGFACHAIVTGLTLGTAIWIDISVAAIVGGTGQAKNVSITAFEL